MRQLLTILGIIAAILATVLSVTPLSKIAYLPSIAALIFGGIAFYLSRQKQYPKKTIQLIFLLTAISLTISTYKALFGITEVGNVETLELKDKASEQEALDELEDIEIDDMDLDMKEIKVDSMDISIEME